jgi:hypothetical protein
MTYQVFVYDERFKSVRVSGGLTHEQAEKIAAERGGWIEEEL